MGLSSVDAGKAQQQATERSKRMFKKKKQTIKRMVLTATTAMVVLLTSAVAPAMAMPASGGAVSNAVAAEWVCYYIGPYPVCGWTK
jgi:hypothetical protein